MSSNRKDKFKFNKYDSVGAAAAEDDKEFLLNCFYDNGDIQTLINCSDNKCIVVGRTGVGKSALLIELNQREHFTVLLNPDELSFRYLADSEFLQTLESIGVNLSLFYKLLWKHIICVEMIKMKFKMRTEKDQNDFLSTFLLLFKKDKKKERALDYLRQWGESFWQTTEHRVKEVTEKLESDINSKIGAELSKLKTSIEAQNSFAVETKSEVLHKAQKVIDQIQIAELNEVVQILTDEYFNDCLPRHFVVIDKLDEDWVDDKLRFKLIKALIENARDFSRVPGLKVIIALRQDLLERVIRLTREVGFQEEKYRSFFLNIRWSDKQLLELLELRIRKLISHRYKKSDVSWIDIFPKHIVKIPIDEYLGRMTLNRPRDILEFFNYCHSCPK